MDFLLKTNGNKQGFRKSSCLAWDSGSKIVPAGSNGGSVGISIAKSSTTSTSIAKSSIAISGQVSISIGTRVGITRIAKTITSVGITSKNLGLSISIPLAIVTSCSESSSSIAESSTSVAESSTSITKTRIAKVVSISIGRRVGVTRIAKAITRVSSVSAIGGSQVLGVSLSISIPLAIVSSGSKITKTRVAKSSIGTISITISSRVWVT